MSQPARPRANGHFDLSDERYPVCGGTQRIGQNCVCGRERDNCPKAFGFAAFDPSLPAGRQAQR
jgi:hypothetical protein